MGNTTSVPLAIVGLGSVLPDAPNVASFWQNVREGRSSITEVPRERWDPVFYYDPDPRAPDKTYSKIGGWVRAAAWDPVKWHLPIPPRVSDAMDGAQRWAIACTVQALADYGFPSRPLDLERTAVILGNAMGGELHYKTTLRISFPELAARLAEAPDFLALPPEQRSKILHEWHQAFGKGLPEITEDSMPGELSNCIAGRLANLFNFRGPNYVVDAACASAMAAISGAAKGLVEREFDAAITGGVDRNMGASSFIKFSKIGALSATGSRPYAEGADGFVMGEGAVLFVLKRLDDAERDGDRIYAVLLGIGASSDGKGKGITAPNPIGQRLAITRAWQNAGVSPDGLGLVEGHGTSTAVGDVVEFESLVNVLGAGGGRARPAALGSVKSNIGHLKAAAGAAGLLKVVLALHDKVLPPSINFTQPNHNIDFRSAPFYVNTELREWPRTNGDPRLACASAFGFGGTNFHCVLQEYDGNNGKTRRSEAVAVPDTRTAANSASIDVRATTPSPSLKAPLRGALVIGAQTISALRERLLTAQRDAAAGRAPALAPPSPVDLESAERIAIDFGSPVELADRAGQALKALDSGLAATWKLLRNHGVFRGSGTRAKVAFLYPGQGSQYVNMLRGLCDREPIVAQTFAEADEIARPLLGKPLTEFLFVDNGDPAALARAEDALRQTSITQPAVLTVDLALTRLLGAYGIVPDLVMGHSLGEYGALQAADALPFADAIEAVSARGREMTRVAVADNGKMAAVSAPVDEIEKILRQANGYVVIANVNSRRQAVIGGATAAVERVIPLFEQAGYSAVLLPVSHAFHTSIVAPASEPLRRQLSRLRLSPPKVPIVCNVTGELYPTDGDVRTKMLDLLARQVAEPVQFTKGLDTLYASGARIFVEVGPKKALHGFVDDAFGDSTDVLGLFTNHPKFDDAAAFNQALCGLYAAGLGQPASARETGQTPAPIEVHPVNRETPARKTSSASEEAVVVTGAALGLPGSGNVFDDENVARILHGEQCIDVVPARARQAMLEKRITRLVKTEDGSPRFDVIDHAADVIKLAGRSGHLDLTAEFGVPAERVEALDSTTALAIGAGLDALRDAGLPLVLHYRTTSRGTKLPDRWGLPEALREETGVIFASAFPGCDAFASETSRYYADRARRDQRDLLRSLQERLGTLGEADRAELDRRIADLQRAIDRNPYVFDRRFLMRVLPMGHSQFAELIGARGPNTQLNAACASTTQAVSLAQDWIQLGRCRRVVVISADNVTSDNLLEWIGSGFLASGAAATDELIEDAVLPFDRRRHGLVAGMGAAAIVLESMAAARERALQPICEVLASVTANSAYHGTRLNVEHISTVMEALVRDAEARWGIDRAAIAPHTVFMSHETYTPARGGSASAEAHALRHVFGEKAREIVIANTKGFTGHAMGAGIEDVTAIKSLETGLVPPVANFKEVDPELGPLNLSLGGVYPVRYALRLAAGFGSQISMSLLRWVPTASGVRPEPDALGYDYRLVDRTAWAGWLARVAGKESPELEVVQRTLRVRDAGRPAEIPSARAAVTNPATQVASEPPAPNEPTPAIVPKPVEVAATPLEPVPQMVAAQPSASTTAAAATSTQSVRDTIVALVVEKTGYPADMLDLDLDLEADLGIDTVKQAELLAAIRGIYSIPRDASLKLRDFPTLNHVIRFVTDRRPDLQVAAPVAPSPAVAAPDAAPVAAEVEPKAVIAPAAPPPATTATPTAESVKERILALVVEKTGYPAEMLDLDLDLEADLGIDTVKQAELLAAIRGIYSIPRDQSLKLRDFPTLNHVMAFVLDRIPPAISVAAEAVPTAPIAQSAPSAPAGAPTADSIRETIVSLVVEKTGYPAEMLDLDLDLEADLGIDTVKQAELLAAIRGIYSIPRDQSLKLRDFPTLHHVIRFVMDRRPDLNVAPQSASAPAAASTLVAVAAPAGASASVSPSVAKPVLLSLQAADSVPRRVPVPVLRLSTRVCKPTGVVLGPGTRVVVGADESGTGTALAARLANRGVEVLTLDTRTEPAVLAARLADWAAAGPIQGVFWLPALDAEGDLKTFSVEGWRAALHQRVTLLYIVARALYEQMNGPGHFLVAATRLGGQHGYDEEGAVAPLGGAVTGFVKAFSRERPESLVKAVDFAGAAESAFVADRLIDETLHDPCLVEVGYKNDLRWSVGLADEPAPQAPSGLQLSRDTVFVITGAAGSIVSAITTDLAAASGGRFYLLDRVPEPDAVDPDIPRLKADKEALKHDLAARLQTRGEKPTPALVERELARIERAEAALAAIRAVAAAGGSARYLSVDLTDAVAVERAIDVVRREAGRVDVLVHAAGLEISHFLPDKKPEEYARVFDVKSDGWFNVVRAIGDMPLRSAVVFSSIAGRFGNAGQTDYAAANDLLCKIASSFRHTRPETRALAIDWTAWRDIGMASRGSIPRIMEQVGIEMLPPEAGVPTVRRELTRPTSTSEVVVARALGLLLPEQDARETVTPEELLAGGVRTGPMVGVVTAMTGDSLTVETTLDPTVQPFLNDHRIEGTAVLPAVMGIEAFAEIALLGAPANWTVGAVEDVTFAAPFKFYKDQPRTLTFDLRFRTDGEDLVAECRLTGTRLLVGQATPQATEHFTGRVRLVRAPIDLGTSHVPVQPDMTIDATGIYRIYFHGPAYQVLEKVWATEEGPVGRMPDVLPANHVPCDQPAVMRPRLIELCFQTAGIWEIQAAGRMALPHRIGRVSAAPFVDAAAGAIYAMGRPGIEKGTFDAVVVDSLGRVLVVLRGYGTTEVPDPIDERLLRDVLAHVATAAGA